MRMSEVRVGMRFKREDGRELTVTELRPGWFRYESAIEDRKTTGAHLGFAETGEVAPWLRLVDE